MKIGIDKTVVALPKGQEAQTKREMVQEAPTATNRCLDVKGSQQQTTLAVDDLADFHLSCDSFTIASLFPVTLLHFEIMRKGKDNQNPSSFCVTDVYLIKIVLL